MKCECSLVLPLFTFELHCFALQMLNLDRLRMCWVSSLDIFPTFVACCLFFRVLQLKPWGSPSVGWDGNTCSCFPTSAHAVMHTATSAARPLLRQLHCDFRAFSSGVCHVMKITVAESSPGTDLLHKKHFASVPALWPERIRCWQCEQPLTEAMLTQGYLFWWCSHTHTHTHTYTDTHTHTHTHTHTQRQRETDREIERDRDK